MPLLHMTVVCTKIVPSADFKSPQLVTVPSKCYVEADPTLYIFKLKYKVSKDFNLATYICLLFKMAKCFFRCKLNLFDDYFM